MNNIEIIQTYLLRNSIKKAIEKNFIVTHQSSDYVKRGEVSGVILDKLRLPKNNKNQKLIRNILSNLGVKPTVLTGVRIYRGIVIR